MKKATIALVTLVIMVGLIAGSVALTGYAGTGVQRVQELEAKLQELQEVRTM